MPNNGPEKPWPWILGNTDAGGHMSLYAVGDYCVRALFEDDFKSVLEYCKDNKRLAESIHLTEKYDNVNLPTANDYRTAFDNAITQCEALEAGGVSVTFEWLVTHERATDWAALGTTLDALNALDFTIPFLADLPGGVANRRALVNDKFLEYCGRMTVKEYRSAFLSAEAYEAAYTPIQRGFFSRARRLALFTCTSSRGALSVEFVNDKCWSLIRNRCESSSGDNCDGGPGPGTDTC